MNRKNYTDAANYKNQFFKRIGGHLVELLPTDIAMIVNKFVKDRPQKHSCLQSKNLPRINNRPSISIG